MLDQKIASLISKIESLAPDALAAASRAIYYDAIGKIIGVTIALIIILALIKPMMRWWKDENGNWIDGMEAGAFQSITSILYAVAGIIVVVMFFVVILDPATWMALFDQKAYIAHKLLSK